MCMCASSICACAGSVTMQRQFLGRGSTEELATHNHGATTSTDSANGQFSGLSGTISGVFSKIANQNSNSNLDKPYYDRVAINFEHNHNHDITIGNTGSNASHENRMPYEAVQRWVRTA